MIQNRYSIGEIERLTGISKEKLRIWERRYCFPDPQRDPSGDRYYADNDLMKLKLIRTLLDHNQRPRHILKLDLDELRALHQKILDEKVFPEVDSEVLQVIELLKSSRHSQFYSKLSDLVMIKGSEAFLLEYLGQMSSVVGELWARGELTTYQEHHYSEQIHTILREIIVQFKHREGHQPRFLITTLEGDFHQIGALMVYTYLTILGFETVYLGANLPEQQIRLAMKDYQCDILALSISASYNSQSAQHALDNLQRFGDFPVLYGGKGAESIVVDSLKFIYLDSLKSLKEQVTLYHNH
jgi:methanogenic corrinoid protein MtbC1